jgi:hypothetical protein
MVAEVMYVPGVAREPHFPESVRRNVPRSSLHPQSGRAAVVVVVVVVSDVVVFDAGVVVVSATAVVVSAGVVVSSATTVVVGAVVVLLASKMHAASRSNKIATNTRRDRSRMMVIGGKNS